MTDELNQNPDLIPASDEYDFSGDGEPQRELQFQVTGFERVEKDGNIRHVFTLVSDELPFPIKMSEWAKHTNETAQRIGRGNLKRLALAATDGESARYDAEGAPVVGTTITATMYEDDAGFRRIKRPKAVKES